MELPINKDDNFQNNIDINTTMLNQTLMNLNMQDSSMKNVDDLKPKVYSYIDDRVLRMMSMMGFKSGEGLGQNNQGIIDPVAIASNLGRRGLGHVIEGLDASKLTWDSDQEVIEVEETIYWLETCTNGTENCKYIEKNNLADWSKLVPKKLTIEDETQYCNPELLQKVLKAKEVFDELDQKELCKARSRANPFETLRSAIFMNRAALKMANIDAVTGFMFTNVDRQMEHTQNKNPYFFADICSGPGGFSEYILWRKRWAFKGFGITLRGDHDFKLHESTCASAETFEALYGALDDGNIYYPGNIKEFCNEIKSQTNGLGVHFVMADGGFSVEGQENIQEVLSKRLYVCQCLTALSALRTNGHFVVKMFDLFTPFSVGLIFLMYHCFHKIAIIKPNSSRPANSERYLICARLKNDKETELIRYYMEQTVQTLWDLENSPTPSDLDIYEMVPSCVIQEDYKFYQYIIESNNRLAHKQIIGLLKLATFCRDPTLYEPRQVQLREKCLQFWRIPNKSKKPIPPLTINDIVTPHVFDLSYTFAKEFNSFQDLNEILVEPEKWHCMFVESGKKFNLCNIYVGVGYNRVYRYQNNRWVRVKCVRLVKGTILFGELVKELSNTGDKMYKRCLHVIDALRLGDTSLADLPYQERFDLIKIYCKALCCKAKYDLAPIRTKNINSLLKLQISALPNKTDEGYWRSTISKCDVDGSKYCFNANAMLLLKTDFSQNFYSTMSSRIILHLSSDSPYGNTMKTLNLWQNITSILQKKYIKNT